MKTLVNAFFAGAFSFACFLSLPTSRSASATAPGPRIGGDFGDGQATMDECSARRSFTSSSPFAIIRSFGCSLRGGSCFCGMYTPLPETFTRPQKQVLCYVLL